MVGHENRVKGHGQRVLSCAAMAKPHQLTGAVFVLVFVALGVTQWSLGRAVEAQSRASVQAPRFEVDPMWPRPMPNHWLLGNAIGVWADDQDHIWIVHRGADTLANNEKGLDLKSADCCAGAPPVLEFDQQGNLVRSWGGPGKGYDWPASNHGIFVDHTGNVWIGGNGPGDSHVVKFTRDGKFLAQYGKPNARQSGKNAQGQPTFTRGSNDPENFGRVAKIFVDPKANEAYLADGYFNRRVAVLDAATGKMKRYWGAYGSKPDDADQGPYNPDAPAAKQFGNPVHCADLSNDGFVYVCDRINDRLQVFKADGAFVKEVFLAKNTKLSGSVWDVAFSRDREQRYLYVADGINNRVYVLNRLSLEVLTSFGDGGRQPSQFYGVHSIATDSRGNIYTTETWEGKRLQKFTLPRDGAGHHHASRHGVATDRRQIAVIQTAAPPSDRSATRDGRARTRRAPATTRSSAVACAYDSGIHRIDAVQERHQAASGREGERQAKHRADAHERDRFADHQPQHVLAIGAERHPHAELGDAARHAVGDGAIQARDTPAATRPVRTRWSGSRSSDRW